MADGMGAEFEAAKNIADELNSLTPEQQARVLRWVAESCGITPSLPTPAPAPAQNPPTAPAQHTPPPAPTTAQDIKSFITAKNPTSDNQLAAVVAYYHRFAAPEPQRKETINADDLQEACRLANRDRLGDPGKTLRNAKDYGYLDLVSRGQFGINTVGENLVAVTLPSDGSGTPRKRATRKKARTKTKATKKATKKASKRATTKKRSRKKST